MKYLFAIFKLRALQRLHSYHVSEQKQWYGVMITMQREGQCPFYAHERFAEHLEEGRKVERLIKYM